MAIESPCIQVCSMDPRSGLCLGCGRTIEEISGWAAFSAETRAAVMARLETWAGPDRPQREELPLDRPARTTRQAGGWARTGAGVDGA